MGYKCFEVEESDHVAHVRLSRGDELNTMISEFWTELRDVIDEISDSGRSRVIVLSAEGRHFSAGLDLTLLADPARARGDNVEVGRLRSNLRLAIMALQDSFNAFERARMPVLAAIHGACVGGAFDMVTAADCRYATANAWFCAQEINIGMAADVGTLQRLPKLIPSGVAREYAYTGRRMTAQRAQELGLVNEVFEDKDTMMREVMGIAAEIASKSPLAVYGTKVALNYARDHTVEDSLQQIAVWQSGMFHKTDLGEAFEAQAEGRVPVFEDLPEARLGI